MARDPGLALAQDSRQLADRQLAMGAERQQAETRFLRRRTQSFEQLVHGAPAGSGV